MSVRLPIERVTTPGGDVLPELPDEGTYDIRTTLPSGNPAWVTVEVQGDGGVNTLTGLQVLSDDGPQAPEDGNLRNRIFEVVGGELEVFLDD
jgi:hypothetical protein